jgi:hypothetical protein
MRVTTTAGARKKEQTSSWKLTAMSIKAVSS